MNVGTRLLSVLLAGTLATSLPAGAQEKVINGQLTANDPQDPLLKKELNIESPHKVHDLEIEAGAAYVIDLESADFDALLRVENPAGETVALDDDSGEGFNSRVTVAAADKGKFRVIAAALKGTGSYTLKYRPTMATLAKHGKLARATDAHQVKLTPGNLYIISLTSKDFDTFVRVEDPTGVQIAKDDDGGAGTNSRIAFEPSKEGDYKIIVSSFGDDGRGAYDLTIVAAAKVAVPAPLTENSIKAALTENDPRDKMQRKSPCKLYTYKMHPGTLYTIDLISEDFDAFLRLEAPAGNFLKVDDDGGGDLNSRIAFAPTAAGEYRIVATSLGGGSGNFTLRVQPSKSKGVISEKKELKVQSSIQRFKAAAGKRYLIDLKSTAFDPFMRLNSPGGNEVAKDDDGGDGLNSRIVFEAAEDGEYEIVVTSFDGDGRGEYELTVRELEAEKK